MRFVREKVYGRGRRKHEMARDFFFHSSKGNALVMKDKFE